MRNANLYVPVSAPASRHFQPMPLNGPMRNIFIETRRTTLTRKFKRTAPRILTAFFLGCGAIGVGFAWYVAFVIGVTRG